MKKIMKYKAGICALLLFIVSNYSAAMSYAENIEIKNDVGEDVYIALVKATLNALYPENDNVRLAGSDGLLKAGASVIIKNFPKTRKNNYTPTLWLAESANDLDGAIKAQSGMDKIITYIPLDMYRPEPTMNPRPVPVINNTIKIRILPQSKEPPFTGYGEEFLSK